MAVRDKGVIKVLNLCNNVGRDYTVNARPRNAFLIDPTGVIYERRHGNESARVR